MKHIKFSSIKITSKNKNFIQNFFINKAEKLLNFIIIIDFFNNFFNNYTDKN